jgi:hypothetical protein
MSPIDGNPLHRPRAERDEEEHVARLIAAAGPPPPTPELDIARLQEAARSQWRRRYAWRRRERVVRRWQIAAAAALVVAVALVLWSRTGAPARSPGPVLAAIEQVVGDVQVLGAAGSTGRPALGTPLAPGTVLRTAAGGAAPGRVALRWSDGRSLRLDAGSELVLVAANRVALVRGGVYLDSDGRTAGESPTVETPRGRFREIGTQFEVRVEEGEAPSVRLRVREGVVAWRDDGRAATAEAGVELALGADGSLRRDLVAPYGADWAWVLAAAPAPTIEGWPLERFLAWYGRESGFVVRYADEESRALAATVVVHGSVAHLRPDEALAVVLASSGFSTRVEGGALVAAARAGARP